MPPFQFNEKEESICKKGFKLNDEKNKCISKEEFDFTNTKIKKDTTIEAIWSTISFTITPTEKTINEGESFTITATITGTSDTTVKWSYEEEGIASVDKNGKVIGVKAGHTNIVAESNGIKRKCAVTVKAIEKAEEQKKEEPKKEEPKKEEKDEGTISLRATDQCLIGNQDVVTITATVSNAKDETINWTLPKCYTVEKVSDTVIKLNRTGRGTQCRGEEERNFEVVAKLNNGNKASLKFNYEPTLTTTVYSRSNEINPSSEGYYEGNNISVKTNVDANFTDNHNYIVSTTNNTATLSEIAGTTITIKTTCGQTKTIQVYAIIN